MLYLTLLTPVLALPGLLLMDRVERWAAGAAHSQAFRAARTVPTGETAAGPTGAPAERGRHRPAQRRRLRADPEPDPHRPRVALR